VYAPLDNLTLDFTVERRPLNASRAGLAMYYPAVVAAVAGVVALRRRGVPSFPVMSWLVNVAITVVAFYGSTRFRAPAEPALVLLAAVGVDALLRRRWPVAGATRGDSQAVPPGADTPPNEPSAPTVGTAPAATTT
jgi:hypothetical protein